MTETPQPSNDGVAREPGGGGGALLEMTGIVKRFPGVLALGGVDLDVRAGEVHCLLGQNGAGKSTLIKVLSAAYQPDEGEILWEGEPVRLTTPVAAMKRGISTIYQELDLVPGLTVTENIFLGHELATAGFSRRSEATQRVRTLLARLGHREVDPNRLVGDLSPAGQQIVSMARALSHDTRLLILDEPSAVLDQEEVDNLFRVVRGLTAEGVAIIYISHRLEEIRQIGDRITVLKDGRTVATGLPVEDTPTAELIRLMTGRSIEYVFPERPTTPPSRGTAPVLETSGLCGDRFRDIDLRVHAGEIVGLAGLVGSGRSEILETIYGARRSSAGTVSIDGRRLRRGSVRAAVAAGVGLAPEERKSQGLLLDQAVYRNVTVSSMSRFAKAGFLDSGAERRAAEELTRSLDVRPAGVDRPVRNLSGGNQQKVVLARWLLRDCKVLLLDEPTRGVDVGARTEIYNLVRRLADEGVAVVVVSSEVEEVLGLADRVLVISEGSVVHEGPATEIDESKVLDLVMEGEVA
ncbi:ribose transport system ATP-binding protein [Nocardioides luteus]|uniref:Sugar ABC transporter ATP-binding protein n=1 Tax=Nocardioides luteus TaxID=1844 RepID=A0ABQ5SUZ1_9ACTN|nr:sugar ABC transporter ATP-binding protein [Nocardioides luteus]MDR7309799.1 ribose transport system ATP-binding protein [Nocardioides luteus]GGR61352.1 sugar ABC transporter ATP-binding protein [Nocardioides luteus]GLJ67292.1 sugar ABC transporter ATP-binding protein [Nocardioides luteus]